MRFNENKRDELKIDQRNRFKITRNLGNVKLFVLDRGVHL